MGLFKKIKNDGMMDVIRCDESSYLIWKWHPQGTMKGESNRENAIRWGSSLRVKDGEVAVFVYNQRDGIYEDFIEGPFDQMISTANFPVIASIIGSAYDGGTPFQAEVYFINLAKIIQVKLTVPFFDVFDSEHKAFSVPVAVRGTISFAISDYREFIKLHRLKEFSLDEFQKQIQDVSARYTKDIVLNAPAKHNIPVIQIETKTGLINDEVEYILKQRLFEDFGVTVSGVDLSAIDVDKTSDEYYQLMRITKNVTTAKIEAQTAADIKNYDEKLRIDREENQYERHKQTQSSNLQAFQIEKQAEVGIAGADALGKMGSNGAGNVNIGGDGTGFNPVTMMAGMAVGGAIGQSIAGAMNASMSGVTSVPLDSVPPSIPVSTFYVAFEGQAKGPFDIQTMTAMISSGQVKKDTLVWQKGMTAWVRADAVSDIVRLFDSETPPPVPQ